MNQTSKSIFFVKAGLRSFAFFAFTFISLGVLQSESVRAQYSTAEQLQLQVSQLNGEVEYLTRVLQNMQGELVLMQKQSGFGSGNQRQGGSTGFDLRLSGLENQLLNITGELERFDFSLRQSAKEHKRFEEAMNARMRELEEQVATVGVPNPERLLNPVVSAPDVETDGAVGVELSGFPAAAETNTSQAFDPYVPNGSNIAVDLNATTGMADGVAAGRVVDPVELYQRALTNFQVADYKMAQQQFEGFLQMFANNKLASNASYWLGETFYSQQDYTRAALQFSDGFTTYRNGIKAGDHLLKLGLSLGRLNRQSEACASFGLLRRRFADTRPALVERARFEAQQISCAQ